MDLLSEKLAGMAACAPVMSINGQEREKGMLLHISQFPVQIVPGYLPYRIKDCLKGHNNIDLSYLPDTDSYDDFLYQKIYQSLKDKQKSDDFEQVYANILPLQQRINLKIIMNSEKISFYIGIKRPYVPTIEAGLKTYTPHCETQVISWQDMLAGFIKNAGKYELFLREYAPQDFYFKNLFVSDQGLSTIATLYPVSQSLKPPKFFIYDVVVQGVSSELWRLNIINLLESMVQIHNFFGISARGGYGFEEYRFGTEKIAPTQALCAAIPRICLVGDKSDENIMNSLSATLEKFSFGNKPLKHITEEDYKKSWGQNYSKEKMLEMLAKSQVYRNGFILTQRELNKLYHLPPQELLEQEYKFDKLTGLKIPDYMTTAQYMAFPGIILGNNNYAGQKGVMIKILDSELCRHFTTIGIAGAGKTELLSNICLQFDLEKQCTIIIETHHDLVLKVLNRVEDKSNVHWLDITDEDYILPWDPFSGQDPYRIAEDALLSFRLLYPTNERSPNIERCIFCLSYIIAEVKDLLLKDGLKLFSKSKEGLDLIQIVLPLIKNESVRYFLTNELSSMTPSDRRRVTIKLASLLAHKFANRVFSQRKNTIDFTKIINTPGLFIFNTPAGILGEIETNILCSMLFSSLYQAALSRTALSNTNHFPTNIVIEEFHRIQKTSLEKSLQDLRKVNCRLFLGLQQRTEMPEKMQNALSNILTYTLLQCSKEDADYFSKKCYGLIEPTDLMRLKVGEGFVLHGKDVFSIETNKLKDVEGEGFADEIIKRSREQFYIPVKERTTPEISKQVIKPAFGQYDEI